jgi:hypothetical protein
VQRPTPGRCTLDPASAVVGPAAPRLTTLSLGNTFPNMSDTPYKALATATLRVLRPFVRILLRHGISYATFAELAKWVFVDVATEEFAMPGRKQSVSRVAVITGLTRKEVTRVQQLPRPDDSEETEQYNRAARVIGGWLRDPGFSDEDEPAELLFEDGPASFSELVRRHSGDVPARAILDELMRVGAVERTDDGPIRLVTRAYVPQSSEVDKLTIVGQDGAALLATMDHNLNPNRGNPRFQRTVAYDNLPDEALAPFRELSSKEAQALLERLNAWLAEQDRDSNPTVKGTGRNRAGLGIFYFEAPFEAAQPRRKPR